MLKMIYKYIQKHTYAYHKGNTMTMKFVDNFPNPPK